MAKTAYVVEGWNQSNLSVGTTIIALERVGKWTNYGHYIPIRDGKLTGIGIRSNIPVTAGTCTAFAVVNGVATDLAVSLTTAKPNFNFTIDDLHPNLVSAGQTITISLITSIDFTPIVIAVDIWLEIEI